MQLDSQGCGVQEFYPKIQAMRLLVLPTLQRFRLGRIGRSLHIHFPWIQSQPASSKMPVGKLVTSRLPSSKLIPFWPLDSLDFYACSCSPRGRAILWLRGTLQWREIQQRWCGDLNLEYSGASMKDTSASLTLTVKHEPQNKLCMCFQIQSFQLQQKSIAPTVRFPDAWS